MKNKKLFKFLMTFVLTITMFVSMNVKAAKSCANTSCTGDNNDFTVVQSDFLSITTVTGTKLTSDRGIYQLYLDLNGNGTGSLVFCSEFGTSYGVGNTYSVSNTMTNSKKACGIVYSLNGGASIPNDYKVTKADMDSYKNNPNGISTETRKRIQKAIWYYETYTGNCNTNLVTNVSNKTISVDAKISDSRMKLVGDYYISEPITISGNGIDMYTISLASDSNGFLPGDAFITVDKEATVGGTIRKQSHTDEELYIKVPASSVTSTLNFKVVLTGEGTVQTWEDFSVKLTEYTSPGEQPVVHLDYTSSPNSKPGTTTKAIGLYSESTSIKVVKTNKENKKPVANATFMLYDKNGKNAKTMDGKDVAAVKTDSNGMITFSNLYYDEDDYNTFVLHEVKPATGYKVIDDVKNQKVQFTIKNGSISITTKKEENKFFSVDSKTKNQINVVNEPIKQKFSKKDVANEDELEGAHIVIKDAKGKIVKEFNSTKKSTEFYLEPGKYTLTETVAPKGYVAIKTEFEFEVLENGDVKLLTTNTNKFVTKGETITLYNYPISVKVPDTGVKKTLYIIIGSILVLAGGALAYLKIKGIDKDIKFPFKKA